MKKFYFLGASLLLAACTSCTNEVIDSPEEIRQNDYLTSWIKRFGIIDPDHTWNMASLVIADVDPSAFSGAATLQIYESRGGRLVGRASRKATLSLDVVCGTQSLYVEALDADKQVVYSGTYPVTDAAVSICAPSKYQAPAASRADAPAAATRASRFDWTLACEDLGSSSDDFDFNDIVLGINHVADTENPHITITPLAAGGTLEAHVLVGGVDKGEIHDLIIPGCHYTKMLNTSGTPVFGASFDVEVSSDWSITQSLGGITVTVKGVETILKAPDVPGHAPTVICIKGDWEWPAERKHIEEAYPEFKTWNQNQTITDWIYTSTEKRIKWITDTPQSQDPQTKPVPEADYSIKMITAQGDQYSSGWTGTGNKIWDYVPGLVTKAMATYCEVYDDKKNGHQVYDKCVHYVNRGVNFTGNGIYVGDIVNTITTGNWSLDNMASGKVLLSLYRMDADNKETYKKETYKTKAGLMYNHLRTNTAYRITATTNADAVDGFWHKGEYPNQMWLDGLYMGAAFMAEYIHTFPDQVSDKDAAWSDIANQFIIINDNTYDSTSGLNYHAWTAKKDAASFWALADDGEPGHSPEFWGRGMGWFIAALVDVLEYMPKEHAKYSDIKTIYKQVADGLIRHQDLASGVWYQLLNHDSNTVGDLWCTSINPYAYSENAGKGIANYLESSASSMITYALLKGIRLGLLTDTKYKTAAEKAYRGLLNEFIKNSGSYTQRIIEKKYDAKNNRFDITFKDETVTFSKDCNIINICKSAGLGPANKPYRDGSISYYLNGQDAGEVVANEGKAIGPFIFASIEYELAHAR